LKLKVQGKGTLNNKERRSTQSGGEKGQKGKKKRRKYGQDGTLNRNPIANLAVHKNPGKPKSKNWVFLALKV